MKIDHETITFIQNVVKTAQLVNIDNIIIEPERVRAIDEDKTVVILQTDNVPDMPFGSIGLSRIPVFQSRLDIAKTQDNFSLEAVVNEGEDFTRSLIMKGKGIKIDYRCAKPSSLQGPHRHHDDLVARVKLNAEAVVLLQKGQAAMSADEVTIISNDEVSFEIVDVNNDVFKHTFADSAESLIDDDIVKFAHRYPIKILHALFKQNPEGYFEIGKKGILRITINNLDVYVIPRT